MFNKFISMLLVFCMVFTLLPVNVFATTTQGNNGETAGLRDGKLQGAYYKWDGLRGTWYWIGPGNE